MPGNIIQAGHVFRNKQFEDLEHTSPPSVIYTDIDGNPIDIVTHEIRDGINEILHNDTQHKIYKEKARVFEEVDEETQRRQDERRGQAEEKRQERAKSRKKWSRGIGRIVLVGLITLGVGAGIYHFTTNDAPRTTKDPKAQTDVLNKGILESDEYKQIMSDGPIKITMNVDHNIREYPEVTPDIAGHTNLLARVEAGTVFEVDAGEIILIHEEYDEKNKKERVWMGINTDSISEKVHTKKEHVWIATDGTSIDGVNIDEEAA